jgi:hypothetical protein
MLIFCCWAERYILLEVSHPGHGKVIAYTHRKHHERQTRTLIQAWSAVAGCVKPQPVMAFERR